MSIELGNSDPSNLEALDTMFRADRHAIMEANLPKCTGVHWAKGYFDWSWKGCGFGQFSFELSEDGKFRAMNEGMGPESSRKLLHALADYIADNLVLEE